MKPGHLFVLSGPSGVGKNRIELDLKKLVPELKRVVTCTTRKKRPNEKNGVAYHFLTTKQFQKMIDADEMIEWANVHDHLYGSRKKDVQQMIDDGKLVLLIIDVQGAISVKEKLPEACLIFIEPESIAQLKMHLAKRKNMEPADVIVRLANAKKELALKGRYDHVIMNHEGQVKKTAQAIAKIIKEAKRHNS